MSFDQNAAPLSASAPLSVFFARYLEHSLMTHDKMSVLNERAATENFREFCGDIAVGTVTAERADAWSLDLRPRYASNTVRSKISLLRQVFRYGVGLRVLEHNPFEAVELPAPVFAGRVLKDRLLGDYIRAFPPDLRRVVRLIAFTGMRRREALYLDWSEIHGGVIELPPHRTKNRKGRFVYLNRAARRCLGFRTAGRVFNITESRLEKCATMAWRSLGVGRIRLHDLRHTAASRHYEKNHDDWAMMEQFGWSSVRAAQAYHHTTDARVRKSMTRLTYAI